MTDPPGCVCGHSAELHEHWRPGAECSTCPCDRYRADVDTPAGRRPALRRLLWATAAVLLLAGVVAAGPTLGDRAAALTAAVVAGAVIAALTWPRPPTKGPR